MVSLSNNSIWLRVWGDLACFTRPEMKVERVSYDVITPSAARNILQCILWKPAIDWHIKEVRILKPIKWISIRRNEVASVISIGNISKAMSNGKGSLGLYVEDDRQQRASLLLRDVDYIIHAEFKLTEESGVDDTEIKFRESFKRRASKGQCFTQPYLGCREFPAFFELCDGEAALPKTISDTRDLGYMLYDLNYKIDDPAPVFFHAELSNGRVLIPDADSVELKR